jgi:hypothetical protein
MVQHGEVRQSLEASFSARPREIAVSELILALKEARAGRAVPVSS